MSTPLGGPWRSYLDSRFELFGPDAFARMAEPLADAWRCGAAAMLDAHESGRIAEARDELARWLRDAGSTGLPGGRPFAS